MSPDTCRAARALLGWSRRELAAKAGVSSGTVRDFEVGLRTPITSTRAAIRRALEDAGVEFTPYGVERRGPAPSKEVTAKPPKSLKRRR